MSLSEDRERSIEAARRSLARAAGALADPPTANELAFALIETATALQRLAKADDNQRALDKVVAHLRGTS